MRAVLWLIALSGLAVAAALFAGQNPGTVTLYWPPYRVDLSLNLVLLALVLAFGLLHLALKALGALLSIPEQARNWRRLQRERALNGAFIDALSHLGAGRFVRSRKAAELAVALEASLRRAGETLPYGNRVRALAHSLAAESAHALQNRSLRDQHLQQALECAAGHDAQDVREGVLLRAARWSFDERDAAQSLQWLQQLPQGAARRTLALRLRFKAAKLAGHTLQALETVRLLTKHRAYSELAGRSIAQGLALELLGAAHDTVQLQRAWEQLDASERQLPAVALLAAEHWLAQEGAPEVARQWLLPLWERLIDSGESLSDDHRRRLIRALEDSFVRADAPPDAQWLARIEAAQRAHPRDPGLQYLAGIVCMHLQLWGKAQQMLRQALTLLHDTDLRRDAWRALAALAEQRNDPAAAAAAYREAAKR